jgi:hypothetical protein
VPLLRSRYSLLGIEDVERFCARVIEKSGLALRHEQRDDALAFLISTCWEISTRYEAGRGSTASFAGFAATTLRLRLVDWQRKEFGRTRWQFDGHTYERERPALVSLDDDSGDGRLGEVVAGGSLDGDRDRAADQLRLLAIRGRPPARYEDEIRKRLPRGAP